MQSWNWPAIKNCLNLCRNPQLIVPKLTYNQISDIDWNNLKIKHGIRGVCLDKDNTITAPYSEYIHSSALESVEKCKEAFGGSVAVFSNSFGSSHFDPTFTKARNFTERTGIKVIEHNSKKPSGAEFISDYFNGLKRHEIALVGDRILTDVVMANKSGFLSILLRNPLTIQGDNIPASIIRWIEQKILKSIDHK